MVTRTESQHASLSLWFYWERALVQEIRWEGRRKWSLTWPVCCSRVGNSVCCPPCHACFLSPRAAGVCRWSLVSLQGEFLLCSWLLQPPFHRVCGEMGILSCISVELEEAMRVPETRFAGSHPLAMKYSFVAAKHSSCPWSSPLLT